MRVKAFSTIVFVTISVVVAAGFFWNSVPQQAHTVGSKNELFMRDTHPSKCFSCERQLKTAGVSKCFDCEQQRSQGFWQASYGSPRVFAHP